MSSVASFKTHVTSQTQYSRRSDTKSSASGYSRGSSAYSQRRKDLLEQEYKKDLEDQLQKQYAEQERHKKLMMENKMRTKAKQDQLNKELETKKQQEEELLKKMKNDKDAAYIKYLKENSKELLKNFKQKSPSPAGQEAVKDPKKGQSTVSSYKKTNSLPNELPPKNPKQKLVANMGSQQSGGMSNVTKMSKEIEDMELYPGFEEQQQDNLEALDLDISRSQSNFKKIIAQYHKDIEKVRQLKEQGTKQGNEKENRNPKEDVNIPIEQFYGNQGQQRPPTSQLLESLDLGSSLTNWNPGKQATKVVKDVKDKVVVEPAWKIHGEEEVEEKIETQNDDDEVELRSNNSQMKSSATRETKKLEKISEVTQKQLKKDWYLKYIDKQSQVDSNAKPPKPALSSTPKGDSSVNASVKTSIESHSLPKGNAQKSLGSLPSNEQQQQGLGNNQKPNLPLPRKAGENAKVKQNDWANDMREDDFYQGLNKQVPSSREGNRSDKNYQQQQPPKPSIPQKDVVIKGPVWDSATKMNAMEADEPNYYDEYMPNSNPKREIYDQPKVQAQVVPRKDISNNNNNPLLKKKQESVTSVAKKDSAVEKGNEVKKDRKNSGLRSKLEGHVNAAQRVGRMDRKPDRGNKKALSPTTRGTRDTDLDVDEFLQDDFNMLNQEEANLQREIVELHRKEIGKVREVEQKHNINVNYQNSRQFISKNVDQIPYADKIINEEDLEDSLSRLDDLLSKQRVTGGPSHNSQITAHFANPILPSNPPPNQYQKDASLYNQIMHPNPPGQGYSSAQQRPQPMNSNTFNSAQPGQYGGGGYSQGATGYSNSNQGNMYGNQPQSYNSYSPIQQGGMQSVQGVQPNPPYRQGYSNSSNVSGGGNSPDFGQKAYPPASYGYSNAPQHQQPNYSGNQPTFGNSYAVAENPSFGANMGGGYGSGETGYSRNMPNKGVQNPQYEQASYYKSENQGGKEVPPEQLKTFSFNSKNMQGNAQEAQRLTESLEFAFNEKMSMVSQKTDDQMSEMGFKGDMSHMSRMTVDDKNTSYAARKQQKKEYQTKKAPVMKQEIQEKPKEEEGQEGTKIVCNANLKHLLMD